jgi:hypothetical protein
MILAMTIVALLLLLIALASAGAWAARDRFSTKPRPAWFD